MKIGRDRLPVSLSGANCQMKCCIFLGVLSLFVASTSAVAQNDKFSSSRSLPTGKDQAGAPKQTQEQSLSDGDPYSYLTETKPSISSRDVNNVDLVLGKLNVDIPLLSFESGATKLALSLQASLPQTDVAFSAVNVEFAFAATIGHNFGFSEAVFYNENIGSVENVFTPVGGGMHCAAYICRVNNADGSYYLSSLGPSHLIYLANNPGGDGYFTSNGTKINIPSGCCRYPDKIEFPDGEIWSIYVQRFTSQYTYSRLRSVSSSKGYTIEFSYQSDSQTSSGWSILNRVLSFNKSDIFCDESALALCSNTSTAIDYVDFTYDNNARSVLVQKKNQVGGHRITFAPSGSSSSPVSSDVQSIEHTAVPGSLTTYTYNTAGSDNDGYIERYVASVSNSIGTWNYTHYRNMEEGRITAQGITQVIGPDGLPIFASGNLTFGVLENLTDQLGRTQSQGLDSYINGDFRIIADVLPEGNGHEYQRDTRNNVKKLTFFPKPSSGNQAVEINATYDLNCNNVKTCNSPLTVADGNGATTTYTYDPNHGGVLTKTMPAVGGINPVLRYAYAQRYPWLKNASSSYSPGSAPIWLLTQEKTCRTTATVGASCSGGSADEIVTDYDYGPNSGPNNLLLKGVAVTADGQTLRTCYRYNARGDRISATTPRAGLSSCP